MSETPRTDAAAIDVYIKDANGDFITIGKAVHSIIARQLERELNEALKWKEEDPRMLREQIRVSDLAFNRLQQELNEAKAKLSAAENIEADQITEIEMALYGGMPDDDLVIDGTDIASHIWRLRRRCDQWRECAQFAVEHIKGMDPLKTLDATGESIARFDELEGRDQ